MKNLIIQSLETKGVLGQIRAQLRSSVFKIVDEQDQQFNFGCGLKWENPTLYKILETRIGTLLAEIIRDFMEYFRMDYSLSIFIPECGISPERLKKEEILGKIGLGENEQILSKLQLPLLYYIMHFFIQNVKENPIKVLETILNVQDDLEKKSDEIIDNNLGEYLRSHREEDDIPLSNNYRENPGEQPEINKNQNNNNNINTNNNTNNQNNIYNNNNNINNNNNKDIDDEYEKMTKKKSYEDNDIGRRGKFSLENPDENTNNNIENVNKNEEPKFEENVEEEIIVEDINDSMNDGKKSSGAQNSQSISGTQYDNTVNSGALDNMNYIEKVVKPEQ